MRARGGCRCSWMAKCWPVTVDGANAHLRFRIRRVPPTSLELFRNGIVQKPSVDYSLTGATVQFLTGAIPQSGDTLLAWYRLRRRLGRSVAAQTAPGPQITCSATGNRHFFH